MVSPLTRSDYKASALVSVLVVSNLLLLSSSRPAPFTEIHALLVPGVLIRTEILALRKGMWERVSSRSHHPLKVYPFGPHSDECMLHGTVDYRLKDGGNASVPWAARAVLVTEGEVVRFKEYQVYLDTAAQSGK